MTRKSTKNPLAYINHLRGAGSSLRAQVDAAAEIQARIAALQNDLAALEKSTLATVAQNWSAAEISEAKADAARD